MRVAKVFQSIAYRSGSFATSCVWIISFVEEQSSKQTIIFCLTDSVDRFDRCTYRFLLELTTTLHLWVLTELLQQSSFQTCFVGISPLKSVVENYWKGRAHPPLANWPTAVTKRGVVSRRVEFYAPKKAPPIIQLTKVQRGSNRSINAPLLGYTTPNWRVMVPILDRSPLIAVIFDWIGWFFEVTTRHLQP